MIHSTTNGAATMVLATIANTAEVSMLIEFVRVTGPIGAAIVLLVLASITLAKYAILPIINAIKPISNTLHDAAKSSEAAGAAHLQAAKAYLEVAEAWTGLKKNERDTIQRRASA